jgi:hypothetical protein
MAFLLTWHGTLLCRHRHSGALIHRPLLPAVQDDAEPVTLDVAIQLLQPGFSDHVRAAQPKLPVTPPGELRQFQLHWGDDQRTVTLSDGSALLSAEPHGDRTEIFRTEAHGWENFLPLSAADLEALRTMLGTSWLVASSGALVERPEPWQYFLLRFGDVDIDLRYQLPFDLANWPFRLTVLRDGWRVERIFQYRPLIYYAAFGSPEIMQQLAISIRSLIEFGRYRGPILVLTDQSPTSLSSFLTPDDAARVSIFPFEPHDRPGFMTARYILHDWPQGRQFQPVLYVDTDTVFDNEVAPMLQAIAMADRIAAPVELMSTLARSPASGATLMQRDLCSPGFLAGFNSGTLGIPNFRDHAESLRLIRRIIVNHGLLHGREALPFADQEIANYVAYRTGCFDTALISRFVRYAGHDAHEKARCGLVHFWPVPGAAERARAMRNYLERLRTG